MSSTTTVIIRPYKPADRAAVRVLYGSDEFARPQLLAKYPQMRHYLADSMAHYYDIEPESTFVATWQGEVIGSLLGTVDTQRNTERYRQQMLPLLRWRSFTGGYGWPGWLWSIWRTEWASKQVATPEIDLTDYPAHLHIGVQPQWRRQGIGTQLMTYFATYLHEHNIAGYHLYASSFHPLGVAFYHKLGLSLLGQFPWRFHNGVGWITATEYIFGQRI